VIAGYCLRHRSFFVMRLIVAIRRLASLFSRRSRSLNGFLSGAAHAGGLRLANSALSRRTDL